MAKCKAQIKFGDDYATFHCGLKKSHDGQHQEIGNLYGEQPYLVQWDDPDQRPLKYCLDQADDVIYFIKSEIAFYQDHADDYKALTKTQLKKIERKFQELIGQVEQLVNDAKTDKNFDSNAFLNRLDDIEHVAYKL